MYILGIDPGKNGGLCILSTDINDVILLEKMPQTPTDISNKLEVIRDDYWPIKCYLEKVGGMPGQGGVAMFNFGYNFGQLVQALTDYKIPHELVTPQKWQSVMNLRGKSGESKTAHKNRIKDTASRLHPLSKVTLWGADAVMIAEYGKQLNNK